MLQDYLQNFESVVLSTIDKDNFPFTSYAPFIKVNNKYYVYISAMARHYRNLSLHDKASLFFVEDESATSNIFARQRVVIQCNSKKLPRDTKEFEELINLFEQKHGKTVSTLKTMSDFSFFEFEPFGGEAVFGFGKAYNLGGENFDEYVERNNAKGHGHSTK